MNGEGKRGREKRVTNHQIGFSCLYIHSYKFPVAIVCNLIYIFASVVASIYHTMEMQRGKVMVKRMLNIFLINLNFYPLQVSVVSTLNALQFAPVDSTLSYRLCSSRI